MDMLQNSDFFFVVESFKIFFEKVLTAIHDPKGIAIQEWLKFKDKLTAKDATPSSIYCYAHQLVISESQQQGENIVKLKRQSSRRNSKKANTPRKITRRNSFGSESPLNKNDSLPKDEGSLALATNTVSNPSNFSAATQAQAGNGSQQSEKMNQYSPWIDNDRKKNPSPAKRITTNEIQQVKGLDELSKIKDTKLTEQQETTRKLLLEKVKKCVEQFQKDSTSLDLINDRSFQTQTMIITDSSKRKVYDRGIKRQDSKFIREFSIYKKNNPNAVQGNTPGSKEPTSQFAKEFQKDQPDQFAPTALQPSSNAGANAGNNNILLGLQIDYIKSKNNPTQPDFYSTAGYGVLGAGNTGGITGLLSTPSTAANYLGTTSQKNQTMTYQTNPALYMPSHHKSANSAGGNTGLIGTTTTTTTGTGITSTNTGVLGNDDSKKGIDDIVQRILKEQKAKEDQDKLNQKKLEQDKMVQEILNKHKLQQQQGSSTSYQTTSVTSSIPSYTPSTTPNSYQYPSSITTAATSPYLTSSPIKGLTSINTTTTTNNIGNPVSYAGTYGISSLQSSNNTQK
ncbi:hypothetical protein TTHERM_00470790 (macronuclear) [Tetrahymena thermophila SB210]|uniref:Uncharacterized protein n=1 Tax=Tetrahymena thermophila (strain SB210) TaxID=312017 RepID=I7M6J2_TETTS|nr:hypothetical protein TTHERM_00470790 [Tetrahymena thermophila SB210]EAR85306.1 hypothetical protein TTHERM_00470790 [Tetrahymena thermophila SB210]|eukprot:XP_001032969.1 hypothetical protein TTHERM_00470790 [Tetrahymena thermophila SB210]